MNLCPAELTIESVKRSAGKAGLWIKQEGRITDARGAHVSCSSLPESEWLAPPQKSKPVQSSSIALREDLTLGIPSKIAHGFRVGDLAFFLLLRITGVPFEQMLPENVRAKVKEEGVYAYFRYTEVPANRAALQRR
jgi:hypothetical protein